MVRINPGRRQKDCISAKVNVKLLEKLTRERLVSLTVRFFDVLFKPLVRISQFFTTGPPALPELKEFPPDMGTYGNVTLSCEAYHLDFQKTDSYQWKWIFNDSVEIRKQAFGGGKYGIFSEYSSPNSCQQTKGFVALQIARVNTHDLGQYKCKLLDSDSVIAVKDIPLLEDGRFSVLFLTVCILPSL